MRFGLSTIFILALLLPTTTSAIAVGDMGGESFTVSVSPQYPEPQSQATLSVLSSSIDLANAIMVVSVAGKEIYQGSVRPTDIQLGKTGSITNAKVTISSAGANYSKTVSIQPQDVSIIAEPISSAPILYLGKPLIPIGGNVRIIAVANVRDAGGKTVDPSALSYLWTVDGVQIANASGIGKEVIIAAAPLEYRSRSVSVDISSQDKSLVGGASFSFTAKEPLVRIYENDPLFGILFDKALSSSYEISGAEDTLFAAPFSFPLTNGAPTLEWFLNGTTAQTGNSITLRPTGSGQGSASLSLVASSGELTKVTESLSLLFGAKTSGLGLFGL